MVGRPPWYDAHGQLVEPFVIGKFDKILIIVLCATFITSHVFNDLKLTRIPSFIGICGGSASGKTTVAKKIIEALDVPWVTLLSMDSFYKVYKFSDH